MPVSLGHALGVVPPQYESEEKVMLSLHQFGRADVGEGIFPA